MENVTVSDKELNKWEETCLNVSKDNGEITVNANDILLLISEIKENRKAKSIPGDIKQQLLFMARNCPEIWERWLVAQSTGCPSDYDLVDQGKCENDDDCRECWKKALTV